MCSHLSGLGANGLRGLGISLRAGSRWAAQPLARNQAAKLRDEKLSLPWSLLTFYFHPETAGKNKSINLIGSMNFGSLDLSGKK